MQVNDTCSDRTYYQVLKLLNQIKPAEKLHMVRKGHVVQSKYLKLILACPFLKLLFHKYKHILQGRSSPYLSSIL
jgi:hypothetical protein